MQLWLNNTICFHFNEPFRIYQSVDLNHGSCLIIRKFSRGHHIIALKISPHKHWTYGSAEMIYDTENLYIAEEKATGTGKETSRMFQAGAARSFIICAEEEQLPVAMNKILELSDVRTLFVAESGGLGIVSNRDCFLS